MKIPTDEIFRDVVYSWRCWLDCHVTKVEGLFNKEGICKAIPDDVLTEVKEFYIDYLMEKEHYGSNNEPN